MGPPEPSTAAAATPPATSPPATSIGERLALLRLSTVRYLRFLGADASVADDLAQEALLRALQSGFDATASGATRWLRTAARNGLWQHLARKAREPDLVSWDALDETFARWADDGGDRYRSALDRCVDALGSRERQLLAARYGSEAPRPVIAAQLGLGEEGGKTLLRRVKARLRACIERRLREDDARRRSEDRQGGDGEEARSFQHVVPVTQQSGCRAGRVKDAFRGRRPGRRAVPLWRRRFPRRRFPARARRGEARQRPRRRGPPCR